MSLALQAREREKLLSHHLTALQYIDNDIVNIITNWLFIQCYFFFFVSSQREVSEVTSLIGQDMKRLACGSLKQDVCQKNLLANISLELILLLLFHK